MPKGMYKRNRNQRPLTTLADDVTAAQQLAASTGLTRFDVAIENSDGEPVCNIVGIPAQTKKEAINKAIQRLTFTAERSKS